MSTSCLARHAGYRCLHSGACCTAGWPIHVESERAEAIQAALVDGRLRLADSAGLGGAPPLRHAIDLPPGTSAVLGTTAFGTCVFYDAGERRCAVHRALGHAALPSACQHFPRRCLIERDAIFVSLSHYCPTVARMTLDDGPVGGIVAAPDSLVGRLGLEGLDARQVLPPLLRPGMLADLEGYHAWERVVVAALEAGESPEVALRRVKRVTRTVQSWSPGRGRLVDAVARAADEAQEPLEMDSMAPGNHGVVVRQTFEAVRMAIAEAMRPAELSCQLEAADARLVAPRWRQFDRALGRYLAAHAFGNWSAYLGSGIGSVVRHVEAALDVVRVEAARRCAVEGRLLDASMLVEAFRAADLLLVHLADPRALAEGLGHL